MSIQFKKHYKFAHQGLRVECFEPSQVVENPSEDLVKTATADGVLSGTDEKETDEQEPETKSEPKKTKVKA